MGRPFNIVGDAETTRVGACDGTRRLQRVRVAATVRAVRVVFRDVVRKRESGVEGETSMETHPKRHTGIGRRR